MSGKTKVTKGAVASAAHKDDKKTHQKKSKKMQQKFRDEFMKKLNESNEDLIEISRNIKQTQSQLTQLEETNGKNKKQKMTSAQNNLRNLKKRQADVEKEVKGVLGKLRGLGDEVNLEQDCKGMPKIIEIIAAATKKKKESEKVEEEKKEEAAVPPSPETPKSPIFSLFDETRRTGATFSKPPHFSEFNNSPDKEVSVNRHEQIMNKLRNSIDTFQIHPKKPQPLSLFDRFPMPPSRPPSRPSYVPPISRTSYVPPPSRTSYVPPPSRTTYVSPPSRPSYVPPQSQPSYVPPPSQQSYVIPPSRPSCLVKNENGIYTVRKSPDVASYIHPQFNNFSANSSSYYTSNLVYESSSYNKQPPQNMFANPLQVRDREIDPFGCWKPPQPSPPSFNFSKPSGF